MRGEKPVRRLPIIDLVVVSPWVCVLVPCERVFFAVESEKRFHVTIDVGLHQRRAKATGILRVVDQQRRTGGSQGHQMRVVLACGQVGGIFLNFVGIDGTREVRRESAKSRHLDRDSNPFVQSAEDNGLPAAAR